jgi:nitrite reductase/ring-hydroxylating ferredoxin subunit
VERGDLLEMTFAGGSRITADRIVIAAGAPTLAGWRWSAEITPKRSYLLAMQGAEPVPGMFISAGSPVRSVRTADPRPGPTTVLVGGAGHIVGRTRSENERLDGLREWAQRHFPGATETHAWSAQDYSPHDGVPQMGKLPRGGGHIYMATGYDKWGMAAGIAAARTISGQILGSKPSWATTIGRRITRPAGAAKIAQINAGVGVAQVAQLAEGLRDHTFPKGAGESCTVTTVCTHLGGALDWNDAEKSWDCPLHGSRFTADGDVLEGPATKPLRRRRE